MYRIQNIHQKAVLNWDAVAKMVSMHEMDAFSITISHINDYFDDDWRDSTFVTSPSRSPLHITNRWVGQSGMYARTHACTSTFSSEVNAPINYPLNVPLIATSLDFHANLFDPWGTCTIRLLYNFGRAISNCCHYL